MRQSNSRATRNVGGNPTPWTPNNIPGLVCLLDARDLSKLTLSASKVSAWNDKYGRANNFSQSTGANQPTYVASGMNGFDGISGNGTTAFMLHNANLNGMSFAAGNYQFAIYQPSFRDTDQTEILLGDNGGGGRAPFYIENQASSFGGATQVTGSPKTTGSPLIHVGRTSGTSTTPIEITLNGSGAQRATTTRTSTAGTTYSLYDYFSVSPAANPFSGYIGIIGCGNGNLTDDDKFKIEGYLAWAYNATSMLTGTHPYKSAPPRLT